MILVRALLDGGGYDSWQMPRIKLMLTSDLSQLRRHVSAQRRRVEIKAYEG